MRIIRIGAIWGAVVGAGVALLTTLYVEFRPFSAGLGNVVNRLIFMLCPFLILGFTRFVNSTAGLYLITVVGNAILYAILFAAISLGSVLFKKHSG